MQLDFMLAKRNVVFPKPTRLPNQTNPRVYTSRQYQTLHNILFQISENVYANLPEQKLGALSKQSQSMRTLSHLMPSYNLTLEDQFQKTEWTP